jgi:CubicO group peptidase (beta-lactamase class C family)
MIRTTALLFLALLHAVVGLSPEVGESLREELKTLVRDVKDSYQVGAIGFGVLIDGEPFFSTGVGCQSKPYSTEKDSEHCEPGDSVDANSLFQLASVSKTFASRLAIEAAFHDSSFLDKKVSERVGEKMGTKERPTVRELLSHTAGVGSRLRLEGFARGEIYEPLSDKEFFEAMANGEGATLPTSDYKYANLGTHLGALHATEMLKKNGHIVCPNIVKNCWVDAMKQLFFEDLGMSRTYATLGEAKAAGETLVNGYLGGLGGIPTGATFVNVSRNNVDNTGAAGSVISSTNDLMTWLRWWIKDNSGVAKLARLETTASSSSVYKGTQEGHCIWVPDTVSKLARTATGSEDTPCSAMYTMGWIEQTWPWNTNLKYKWHNGQLEGVKNIVAFDAEEKWGLVVLTNRDVVGVGTKAQAEALVQSAVGLIYEALGKNAKPSRLYWDFHGIPNRVPPWPTTQAEQVYTSLGKRGWTPEFAESEFQKFKTYVDGARETINGDYGNMLKGCYCSKFFGDIKVLPSTTASLCSDGRPSSFQLSVKGMDIGFSLGLQWGAIAPASIPCSNGDNAKSMEIAYNVGRGLLEPGARLYHFKKHEFTIGSPYNRMRLAFGMQSLDKPAQNVTVDWNVGQNKYSLYRCADDKCDERHGNVTIQRSVIHAGWYVAIGVVLVLVLVCMCLRSRKVQNTHSRTFRPLEQNEMLNPARQSRIAELTSSGSQYIPPELTDEAGKV